MPTDADAMVALIRSRIATERRIFAENLPRPRRQALLEFTRALDYRFVAPTQPNPGQVNGAQTAIPPPWLGWGRFLLDVVDESTQDEGYLLTRSNTESQAQALGILGRCGELATCEQILDYYEHRLIVATDTTRDKIVFEVTSKLTPEQQEKLDAEWFSEWVESSQSDRQKTVTQKLEAARPRLRKLARPWRAESIEYDSSPEMDEIFYERAKMTARKMHGQNTFDGTARFGGEPFELYRSTVVAIIELTLKHLEHASNLLARNPKLFLPNLLTIITAREDLAQSVATMIGCTTAEAKKGVEALEFHQLSHLSLANAAPPPLVPAGKGFVIRSICGCLSSPFFYLLEGLKARFRSDWDRAVDGREGIFQNDLRGLFSAASIQHLPPNRMVRTQIGDTDIDAAMFDRHSGTLALFQIKWQDPFRHSMQERRSRKSNFVVGANGWVAKVSHWLKELGPQEVGRRLGVEKQSSSEVKHVRIFVVGRYFAAFSGKDARDPRAAWASWYQLFRMLNSATTQDDRRLTEDLLSWVWKTVSSGHSSEQRPPRLLRTERYKIGGIDIVVQPDNDA